MNDTHKFYVFILFLLLTSQVALKQLKLPESSGLLWIILGLTYFLVIPWKVS